MMIRLLHDYDHDHDPVPLENRASWRCFFDRVPALPPSSDGLQVCNAFVFSCDLVVITV